jgi:hypothetical protein
MSQETPNPTPEVLTTQVPPAESPAQNPAPEVPDALVENPGVDAAPRAEARRQVTVRKMYKTGQVVTKEDNSEVDIQIGIPVVNVPMAEVEAHSSMTINMGNFESVKLELSVRLPCYPEELADAFRAAKNFVDTHLNSEVQAIRGYRDSRVK